MSVGEIASSKIEELRREQEYFDAAQAARDHATDGWSADKWSAGTAVERRAFKRAVEKKQTFSSDDEVAFGRIDLEDGETYYVGKAPIFDVEKNLLVVNWQAPIAAAYNQATAKDPKGLVRRRKFDAPKNRIQDFEDTVFKELAAAVAELEGWDEPDDELLKALSRKRSGSMTDIVKTIQAAQDKIVRAEKDRLLIVQGGPGTGKTAVALHRVSWLLFNYQEELDPEDVLVVGPNPTFTRYIRRVLPDLGDNDVVQRSLQDLLAPGITSSAMETDDVAALKGSAVMADVLAAALDDRIKEPKEPVRVQRRDSGLYVSIPAEPLAKRIKELKSEIYLEGRAKLRQSLTEMARQELPVRGMQAAADLLDPVSLNDAVNTMWPQLNAPQFVRELLGSKDRLIKAAGDLLRASEVGMLHRPMARRIADEPWTLADLALMDEATELLRGESEIYSHIVVDEAQDLSEMQLMAIRRRSRDGSMTVVGDIAQSTGPYATDSWDSAKTLLKSNLPTELVELEHGYRVPAEVFEVARPVLEVAAPTVSAPEIVRSAGADPEFTGIDTEDLPTEVAKIVTHHSGKGRFVGVIAVAEQWEVIRKAFSSQDIQWSESTSGDLSNAINLVTPEDSKGLEFDAVIVVDPQAILDMHHGDRMLYIALTRTTTRLDIVYPEGRLPRLLSGAPVAGDKESETPDSAGDESNQDKGLADEEAEAVKKDEGEPEPTRLWETPIQSRTERTVVKLEPLEQKIAEGAAQLLAEQILSSVQPKLFDAVIAELERIMQDHK
ncbi:UvrD-helicase domain-containing protein [Arthrobacter sp. Marseille-P9274]|uniref:HelD family protein n=1 Tax=Arthrobacter sp. Marseille-P9274 TaxID=2866572 RepID=UPI0021C6CD6C|nr:UvrD-helicase domain-containing protein [Arthrobacter sp. Marseille-P9274]